MTLSWLDTGIIRTIGSYLPRDSLLCLSLTNKHCKKNVNMFICVPEIMMHYLFGYRGKSIERDFYELSFIICSNSIEKVLLWKELSNRLCYPSIVRHSYNLGYWQPWSKKLVPKIQWRRLPYTLHSCLNLKMINSIDSAKNLYFWRSQIKTLPRWGVYEAYKWGVHEVYRLSRIHIRMLRKEALTALALIY